MNKTLHPVTLTPWIELIPQDPEAECWGTARMVGTLLLVCFVVYVPALLLMLL